MASITSGIPAGFFFFFDFLHCDSRWERLFGVFFAVNLQAVLTYQYEEGLFIFGCFGDTRLWSSHNTQHISRSTYLTC